MLRVSCDDITVIKKIGEVVMSYTSHGFVSPLSSITCHHNRISDQQEIIQYAMSDPALFIGLISLARLRGFDVRSLPEAMSHLTKDELRVAVESLNFQRSKADISTGYIELREVWVRAIAQAEFCKNGIDDESLSNEVYALCMLSALPFLIDSESTATSIDLFESNTKKGMSVPNYLELIGEIVEASPLPNDWKDLFQLSFTEGHDDNLTKWLMISRSVYEVSANGCEKSYSLIDKILENSDSSIELMRRCIERAEQCIGFKQAAKVPSFMVVKNDRDMSEFFNRHEGCGVIISKDDALVERLELLTREYGDINLVKLTDRTNASIVSSITELKPHVIWIDAATHLDSVTDLCKSLRRLKSSSLFTIVVFSTDANDANQSSYYASGADDVIISHVNGGVFAHKVWTVARWHELQKAYRYQGQTVRSLASEIATLNLKMKLIMQMDSISGLYNRQQCVSHIDCVVKSAAESHGSVSLLCIELSGLSEINWQSGFTMADEILSSVGACITEHLKGNGQSFHFSEGVFVIALTDVEIDDVTALSKALNISLNDTVESLAMAKEWDRSSLNVHVGGVCVDHVVLECDPVFLMKKAFIVLSDVKAGKEAFKIAHLRERKVA